MTATALIREINKLPLSEKLLVVEKTIKTIREEKKQNIERAVLLLQADYRADKELTAFTQLDAEYFYEAR